MLRAAAQRLAKRAAPRWGAAARPALVPFARHYADDANLLKTALYDFHLEMGGKMVRLFPSRGGTAPVIRPRRGSHLARPDASLVFLPSANHPRRPPRSPRDPLPGTHRHPGSPRRVANTLVLNVRRPSPPMVSSSPQVPFAGHSMPIQYKDSIMEATKHCRTNASIFDVSHMLGSSIRGKDAVAFTQHIVVGDIAGLKDGTGTLSVVTNESGGIIDDTVVTKVNDQNIYIVLNGACSEKDQAHINKHLAEWKAKGKDVDFVVHSDRSLLAFQGPKAADVLQPLTDLDLSKLYFGMFTETKINGVPVWLTRTGYTGEDGFEISLLKTDTVALTKKLLENPAARMCGLGARDSLRLEAGLCLYGNDLDETISPLDAGLTWTIGKSRREACDFVGGEAIKKQLAEGVTRRRVGLRFTGKGAPARGGSKIFVGDEEVGEVTSGGFSPVLGENIAMGYVRKGHAKAGTEIEVETRGKRTPAVVSKMPFVTCHYHRPA
jgi:aminomethyltransferase